MKVNVLTVTFNQLDKLKKLYGTILEQKDYLNRWILYDDWSTDGTREWMRTVENEELPTRFIYAQKREKPLVVANMNECIRAADDQPFILIFADSYFRNDSLKLLSETYIPGSFGSASKINVTPDGQFLSSHLNSIVKHNTEDDDIRNLMASVRPWEAFSGNGMIGTKEIMESIGYIDEAYGGYGVDDYDTAMRAMMNGAMLYLYNNVKLYHVDHPVKESTPDNVKRYLAKLYGEGYRLEP